MKVIRDIGHRYITDKDNTFIVIMDKDDDSMLVQFDYDPFDQLYKVKADHAFDFMKPKSQDNPPEERWATWLTANTNRQCTSPPNSDAEQLLYLQCI